MKTSTQMAALITRIARQHNLDLSTVGAHLRLENEPYMALCLEVIGRHLVSVAHYGRQNGDAMADPEMVFWTDTIDGSWIPVSFRNDYGALAGGRAGESIATIITDGQLSAFRPREQADQARFANTWARNLRAQGFAQIESKGHRADDRTTRAHIPGDRANPRRRADLRGRQATGLR